MQKVVFENLGKGIYCPKTGIKVLDDEDYTPSPAMLCMIHNMADEWTYATEEFRKAADRVMAQVEQEGDILSQEEWILATAQSMGKENILCYAHEEHGMACGPVCGVTLMCFDLQYGVENE